MIKAVTVKHDITMIKRIQLKCPLFGCGVGTGPVINKKLILKEKSMNTMSWINCRRNCFRSCCIYFRSSCSSSSSCCSSCCCWIRRTWLIKVIKSYWKLLKVFKLQTYNQMNVCAQPSSNHLDNQLLVSYL